MQTPCECSKKQPTRTSAVWSGSTAVSANPLSPHSPVFTSLLLNGSPGSSSAAACFWTGWQGSVCVCMFLWVKWKWRQLLFEALSKVLSEVSQPHSHHGPMMSGDLPSVILWRFCIPLSPAFHLLLSTCSHDPHSEWLNVPVSVWCINPVAVTPQRNLEISSCPLFECVCCSYDTLTVAAIKGFAITGKWWAMFCNAFPFN